MFLIGNYEWEKQDTRHRGGMMIEQLEWWWRFSLIRYTASTNTGIIPRYLNEGSTREVEETDRFATRWNNNYVYCMYL